MALSSDNQHRVENLIKIFQGFLKWLKQHRVENLIKIFQGFLKWLKIKL